MKSGVYGGNAVFRAEESGVGGRNVNMIYVDLK